MEALIEMKVWNHPNAKVYAFKTQENTRNRIVHYDDDPTAIVIYQHMLLTKEELEHQPEFVSVREFKGKFYCYRRIAVTHATLYVMTQLFGTHIIPQMQKIKIPK